MSNSVDKLITFIGRSPEPLSGLDMPWPGTGAEGTKGQTTIRKMGPMFWDTLWLLGTRVASGYQGTFWLPGSLGDEAWAGLSRKKSRTQNRVDIPQGLCLQPSTASQVTCLPLTP